jgi:SAM-dependent methyltransferase
LKALRVRGAVVTGIDKSARMLELARRRLGDDSTADLQVAELGSPLPFPDDTFDDVIASLVLHHLEDWGPALTELRRVLKPAGRLIVSVNHPFAENLWHSRVASSLTISLPTTMSLSGPQAARARFCASGTGRCTR